MTNPKNLPDIFNGDEWSRSLNYIGLTRGFSHLAFHNNDLLLVSSEKSGEYDRYNYAYGIDLRFWSPFSNQISENGHALSLSSDSSGIISTAIIKDDNRFQFAVTQSPVSNYWTEIKFYDIPEQYKTTIDLTHSRSRFLADTHFFLYTGFFFYSLRGEWICVPLDHPFNTAKIIDVAYFNNNFFFLLKQNNNYTLLYTSDCESFKSLQLIWPGVTVNSISTNQNQLVVVGSEDNEKKCVILYTEIATTNEWHKISFTPLGLEVDHYCSLYDLLSYQNVWYIVGSTHTFKNKFKFSVKGLTYKIEGNISRNNPILMETNPATNLKRVYVDQNKSIIYAIGESRPTGDYFVTCRKLNNGS